MAGNDFSDAALVLVGHGSTRNAESSAPVYQHAAELRRRGLFAQVTEAFWKQEPRLARTVDAVTAKRVFVAPLFISEGYFTQEAIPTELRLRKDGQIDFPQVQSRGGQTLYYCGPVGTHDSMTNVLLARARAVVEKFPRQREPKPEETALFIAGHGTDRNENSRAAIDRQVALIRARRLYAEVHAVFLEEEPRVGECYRLASAKHVVMLPFFISDGLHVREDIPILLGESEELVRARLKRGEPTWPNPAERNGKVVWCAPAIGTDPGIADVILERVREASEPAPS